MPHDTILVEIDNLLKEERYRTARPIINLIHDDQLRIRYSVLSNVLQFAKTDPSLALGLNEATNRSERAVVQAYRCPGSYFCLTLSINS
jgi:hypothetical protein